MAACQSNGFRKSFNPPGASKIDSATTTSGVIDLNASTYVNTNALPSGHRIGQSGVRRCTTKVEEFLDFRVRSQGCPDCLGASSFSALSAISCRSNPAAEMIAAETVRLARPSRGTPRTQQALYRVPAKQHSAATTQEQMDRSGQSKRSEDSKEACLACPSEGSHQDQPWGGL